jgi:hypothetical protein
METCRPRKSIAHLTKLFAVVIMALALFAAPAMSQNTNPWPASGSVGIGTTAPLSTLHVVSQITSSGNDDTNGITATGNAHINIKAAGVSGAIRFWNNGVENFRMHPAGNFYIGFVDSSWRLSVKAPVGSSALAFFANNDFVNGSAGSGLEIRTGASSGATYTALRALSSGANAWNNLVLQEGGGNVGIGTPTPAAKLDVNGNVNVSGNIAAKYQDVAEWVPATETMEPGTVVVLNPEKSNEVMPATRAYDTTVAGVVSTNPGLILGERAESKAQIATSGRVRVKASAGQPIHIGDLLVTSGKTGMAMKSEPIEIGGRAFHQPGTIIGKALEPLGSGEGEILVLLSLQ